MNKGYQKTTWENSPSTNTPIDADNLNNIENGIDLLDDRIVAMDSRINTVSCTPKYSSSSAVEVAEISINGVKQHIYAPSGGSGGSGGTSNYNDLSNKPKINNVTLSGNKSLSDLGIKNVVANPSITGSEEQLTSIEIDSTKYRIPSGGGTGTSDYSDLSNKPQINGVTLSGNKTLSQLGIPTSYSGLNDKPSINNVVLSGNKSLADLGINNGDMSKSSYDADSTVANAGGIASYVTSAINSAIVSAIEGSY